MEIVVDMPQGKKPTYGVSCSGGKAFLKQICSEIFPSPLAVAVATQNGSTEIDL